ncbi:MAG: ABC transporter permease, partial [Verrucomicrobiota bacterium]
LLLFTSISGGLGVLKAVTERLSVGGKLLGTQVFQGFKGVDETVESALEAGITEEMSDERRIRLAEAKARQSGKQGTVVRVTLKTARELAELPQVEEARPAIHWSSKFSVVDGENDPAEGTKGSGLTTGIARREKAFDRLMVAGRTLGVNAKREVIISELKLYSMGFGTESAAEKAVGKHIHFENPKGRTKSAAEIKKAKTELALKIQIFEQRREEMLPEQRDAIQREIERLRNLAENKTEVADLYSPPYEIVGVFRMPTGNDFQVDPTLQAALRSDVLIPLDLAIGWWEAMHGPEAGVGRIDVVAKSPDHVRGVLKTLTEQGYRCVSLAEMAHRIRTAVLMIMGLATAIATAAFLIAAIGMTNTMVMNVLERRREIGIYKAVGACDRDVKWMFLLEGALVGMIGGLLGLVFGWVFTQLSAEYIRHFLEDRLNEPFEGALFAYPFWLILGTPVVAGLVTTIATYIPARRASQLDPVTTLRAL